MTAVQNDDGVTILEGIRPVLTYQRAIQSKGGRWPRANYVHPLYDLQGRVFTEDFPADHGHHRGIFWAWHQVSVGGKQLGDAWLCDDFEWDVQQVKASTQAGTASLKTMVLWKSSDMVDGLGGAIPLLQESVEILVHPLMGNARSIDFQIQLLGLVADLKIGGSEDVKGYGGFSPRIELSPDLVFSSRQGEVTPETTAVEAGPWVNLTNAQRGLAMMSHPRNPGNPNAWILRSERSMQNAVFPGRHPVEISRSEPTILRYRLVLHDGHIDQETLERLYTEFSEH